jgi:tetratricopeptide (TPR) repeat protein
MIDDAGAKARADQLLQEALKEQNAGRYESAVELYKRSLEVLPTAEGHTFLGWAYSFLGRLDEAIAECRRAIAIDPAFGNPYNDIGSYLMKQNKLEDAIEWLEKAKIAPRYEPRHFPYLNLARLYLAMGRFEDASREYSQAEFLHGALFHQKEPQRAGSGESIN